MSASFGSRPAPERERLIESHLPLVRSIAKRYAARGEPLDDLVQVGAIGLIRASDRFDSGRGVAFATFATPAIEGEIRRHLGDRTTALRIPRELQRMSGELQRCRRQIGASLGRPPTADELATALGVEREDVDRALTAERAREPVADSSDDVVETASGSDLASTDDRLLLAGGARVLNERERRIVFLRFHADMTERDIAREIGISQAHVSRLLAGALAKLRTELGDEKVPPGSGDTNGDRVISQRERAAQGPPGSQTRRKTPSNRDAGTRIDAVGAPQEKADLAAGAAPQQDSDLALPYHVTVKAEGEDERSGWTAALEELPGCEARGATPEAAVEQLRAAMQTWLSAAVEDRRLIPPPKPAASKRKSASSHSGRFLVRMPGALHQELSRAAEREQVSLNRFVTEALAASISSGWTPSTTPRPVADHNSAPGALIGRKRSFRMLLAANVIVIVIAAAAAITLLIFALQRGI
jgi:RNA polymerase sigma-B factor